MTVAFLKFLSDLETKKDVFHKYLCLKKQRSVGILWTEHYVFKVLISSDCISNIK